MKWNRTQDSWDTFFNIFFFLRFIFGIFAFSMLGQCVCSQEAKWEREIMTGL